MWFTVEGIAETILKGVLKEIMPANPQVSLEVGSTPVDTTIVDPASVQLAGVDPAVVEQDILKLFGDYRKLVKDKYFSTMWFQEYSEKAEFPSNSALRSRGKRYVYRFFVHLEQSGQYYIWQYPACFRSWNGGNNNMYPAEGARPPREMTEWEAVHCPWYLDTDKWDNPLNEWEKLAAKNIARKLVPKTVMSGIKEGLLEDADKSAALMEIEAEKVPAWVDHSRKPRKPKESKGKEVSKETQTKSKKGKKSSKATSKQGKSFCTLLAPGASIPVHSFLY
jgi:hypothetical protein